MAALLADAAVRALLLGAPVWTALLLSRNPHIHKLVWRTVLAATLVLPAMLYFRLAQDFAFELPIPSRFATTAAVGDAIANATHDMTPLWRALSAIYIGVAAVMLARFLIGLIGMGRMCRASEPLASADGVRISPQLRSPATFGSVVLLPAAARHWSVAELEAVLAHERA